jgi:hypothetical protein
MSKHILNAKLKVVAYMKANEDEYLRNFGTQRDFYESLKPVLNGNDEDFLLARVAEDGENELRQFIYQAFNDMVYRNLWKALRYAEERGKR